MATAEELLASTGSTNKVLTIDLDSRIITIPSTVRNLGTESDDDVMRVYFKIPQKYGEFDLSKFSIQINYINAGNEGDVYVVNDNSVTNGTITFSWLIDRHVVKYAGDVQFNVCMKILDKDGVVIKEFNTTPATLPVKVGLETAETVVEENPSAFDTVLARLYAIEAAHSMGREGHYNIVSVTENDEGILFTIVDQDGQTTVTVKHGYVPVRGVDYWTPEDTSKIQEYIDNWAPRPISVTLATANWTNNIQTVEAEGVDIDNIVLIAPNPSGNNTDIYAECGIKCVLQATDSLSFECEFVPDVDVKVNVAVYYSNSNLGGEGGELDSPGSGSGSGSGGTITSLTVTDDGNGNVTIA